MSTPGAESSDLDKAAGARFLDEVAKSIFTGIAVGGDASAWATMSPSQKAWCLNVAQDTMDVVEPALSHVAGQSAINALESLASEISPSSSWATIRYQNIPDFIAALKAAM
jgi:dihydrodipicolinate synthase/N-acetylneuraminate lyase